jgi:ABC-type transport system involved in cytochrome bd biosynthesis fused ATPase/permease subunit
MKLFDFLSSLITQSFSFLSPTLIIDQLFQRLQSALKAMILLAICTAMSCVTLAYLIARFLDQLDAGEFVITRSIIFLSLLLIAFGGGLLYVFRELTQKFEKTRKENEIQKTETALENALAALVLSYVNEREEKRKSQSPATQL